MSRIRITLEMQDAAAARLYEHELNRCGLVFDAVGYETLPACGVVGFIVFGIATFGMLETDSVDLPHIGLLALVMLADAALFVGAYLTGRKEC